MLHQETKDRNLLQQPEKHKGIYAQDNKGAD